MGLLENGLREQECLSILSPNDIYYSILGDAVIAAGAIFTCLPATSTPDELALLCKSGQVSWLCATRSLLGQALKTAEQVGIPDDHVLLFDPPGAPENLQNNDSSRLSFSHLLNDYQESQYINPNIFNDPSIQIASRQFTSGTTGTPKAAEISHKATFSALETCFIPKGQIEETFSSRKCLHFVGMHHITGTWFRQQVGRWADLVFVPLNSRLTFLRQLLDTIR